MNITEHENIIFSMLENFILTKRVWTLQEEKNTSIVLSSRETKFVCI
jgi:hypothetical protein